MSQPRAAQLTSGSTSESACDEGLELCIYLCRHKVGLSMHIRSRTFALTVFDKDGVVPRSRRLYNKAMYLFHTYRTRETQDLRDCHICWYSRPEVRSTSYRSSAIAMGHEWTSSVQGGVGGNGNICTYEYNNDCEKCFPAQLHRIS